MFNIFKATKAIPELASQFAIYFLVLFTVTTEYFYVTFPNAELFTTFLCTVLWDACAHQALHLLCRDQCYTMSLKCLWKKTRGGTVA